MHLTLGQIRDALGLTQDTYRHWRTVIPNLTDKSGRNSRFSSGDLLALAIIRALTDEFSIPVGSLDRVAGGIFGACNSHSWTRVERLVVTINVSRGTIAMADVVHVRSSDEPSIVLPCAPIIASLRESLLSGADQEQQAELKFPLSAVNSERRTERP